LKIKSFKGFKILNGVIRRQFWRCQRGNQKRQVLEEQTIQWSIGKRQTMIYKPLHIISDRFISIVVTNCVGNIWFPWKTNDIFPIQKFNLKHCSPISIVTHLIFLEPFLILPILFWLRFIYSNDVILKRHKFDMSVRRTSNKQ
jgi:hypothetical protein